MFYALLISLFLSIFALSTSGIYETAGILSFFEWANYKWLFFLIPTCLGLFLTFVYKLYLDRNYFLLILLSVIGFLVNLINAFSIPETPIYFSIGARFKLGRLRAAASNLNSINHWTQLAISSLIEETYAHQLSLTSQILVSTKQFSNTKKIIDFWVEENKTLVDPTEKLLKELFSGDINDLSMISVASRQIRSMIKRN